MSAGTRVCLSLLILLSAAFFVGCEAKKTGIGFRARQTSAELTLKFESEQTDTYKVVNKFVKDYKFDQRSINKVTEKQTITISEIVFDQKIVETDEQGNAVADITVRQLKYLASSPQGRQVDFDSTKTESAENPLMKVIGKSYKLKIDTRGKVIKVLSAGGIRKAVKKGDESYIVQALFSDDSIKQKHSVQAMPDTGSGRIKIGDTWSRIKTASKQSFEPKTFEKIYILKKIKSQKGKSVAVVEMEAIPTSHEDKEAIEATELQDDTIGSFRKIFTSSDEYNGSLTLDLDNGTVDRYFERLHSIWIAVEPEETQKSDKGPDMLTMGLTTMHSIEKIK